MGRGIGVSRAMHARPCPPVSLWRVVVAPAPSRCRPPSPPQTRLGTQPGGGRTAVWQPVSLSRSSRRPVDRPGANLWRAGRLVPACLGWRGADSGEPSKRGGRGECTAPPLPFANPVFSTGRSQRWHTPRASVPRRLPRLRSGAAADGRAVLSFRIGALLARPKGASIPGNSDERPRPHVGGIAAREGGTGGKHPPGRRRLAERGSRPLAAADFLRVTRCLCNLYHRLFNLPCE